MKKNIKFVVMVMMSVTLLGCGENKTSNQGTLQDVSQNESQEIQQDTPEDEAQEIPEEDVSEETETVDVEHYEDNFAVDSETAKAFAQKVKDAVANKDLESFASLTAFPVYVGLPDMDIVETKEDFLQLDAETIFTERLVESVANADIENFEASMAGFTIWDGEKPNINFGVVDGVLAVKGINY